MFDLREYKDIAKAAVAKECELDENWSWRIKTVNKDEIRIGWGYFDYIGEKAAFVVVVDDTGDEPFVYGSIPDRRILYAFVGTKSWCDYDTIEKAITGIIHNIADCARSIY